jgi:hypothetical protein
LVVFIPGIKNQHVLLASFGAMYKLLCDGHEMKLDLNDIVREKELLDLNDILREKELLQQLLEYEYLEIGVSP